MSPSVETVVDLLCNKRKYHAILWKYCELYATADIHVKYKFRPLAYCCSDLCSVHGLPHLVSASPLAMQPCILELLMPWFHVQLLHATTAGMKPRHNTVGAVLGDENG